MLKPKLDEKDRPKPKAGNANAERFRRSKAHENRIAGKLGGSRLARSGGLPWSKHDSTTAGGDIKTKGWHLEHKRTEHDSMSIKKEWLHKVSAAARQRAKDPGLVVTFENKLAAPEDWVLIPMAVYQRLTGQEG
jgi:hypothetical protein